MTKNQRKPEARMWLDETSRIEDLVVGDVVRLEDAIPLTHPALYPTYAAVFEGEIDGKYSFLNLDMYMRSQKEVKTRRVIMQIQANKQCISLSGRVCSGRYNYCEMGYNGFTKERKSKLELIEQAIPLLRKHYTFDEVVYTDEYGQVQRVEENKSLI